MAIPAVTLTRKDPGTVKAVPGSVIPLVAGVSSSGTVGSLRQYSDEQALIDAYGYGPLVNAAIRCLREGGAPVVVCRLTGAVAAANGTVTQTGAGPLPTLSGTPNDRYDVKIEIMLGGAVATSRFRYSLDNGLTYSSTRATVASFVIPNTGITVAFTAGTYVLGEVYSFTSHPAYVDGTDLTALQTAILASPRLWDELLIAGEGTATGATQATLFAGIASMLTALETAKKYRGLYAILSAGREAKAATQTAFASSTNQAISVAWGTATRPAPRTFEGRGFYEEPVGHTVAARISRELISTDQSRTDSPITDIPPNDDGSPRISHDEYRQADMDDLGFTTLRTWPGEPGVFVTNARIKSAFGSDFEFSQHAVIFNRARWIAYKALVQIVGRNVRTNPNDVPNAGDTGTIAEIDAVGIDSFVTDRLAASLLREQNKDGFAGHVDGVAWTTDRAYDTAAARGVQGKVEIVGLIPIKSIVGTVGYVRQLGG